MNTLGMTHTHWVGGHVVCIAQQILQSDKAIQYLHVPSRTHILELIAWHPTSQVSRSPSESFSGLAHCYDVQSRRDDVSMYDKHVIMDT